MLCGSSSLCRYLDSFPTSTREKTSRQLTGSGEKLPSLPEDMEETWSVAQKEDKRALCRTVLKNRANSGCLYCQPQTKAQGLSLTSFAVDEMPRCLWKDVCLPTCLQGAGGLCLDSSKLHQCISPRPCSSCFVASCSKITW